MSVSSPQGKTAESLDRFGNRIDPTVGYARGRLLSGTLDEQRRRTHALRRLRLRIDRLGRDQIFNFTGHDREFIASRQDIEDRLAEEWVGQSLIEPELTQLACEHFGAPIGMAAGVFNRTASAVLAMTLAFARDRTVVSIAPSRQSHVSIRRAAALARATLVEIDCNERPDWSKLTDAPLVYVTRVTSELLVMDAQSVQQCVALARGSGRIVVIDDAYGARLAPIVLKQPKAFAFEPDLAVTSCDKAGLAGPRAGLLVGRRDLLERAMACAGEIGLEGRAPIVLGVLQALRSLDPDEVARNCDFAQALTGLLVRRFGEQHVQRTMMGPTISEEDLLELALKRHQLSCSVLVPAEASCALAMLLMEESGFLTSNVAERPGARVSLRLRPTAKEVERMGGFEHADRAIDAALSRLGPYLADQNATAALLFGKNG